MSEVRVPRGMDPEDALWALRMGVVAAMRSRGAYLRHAPGAAVIASRTALRLVDQYRRAWLARHPTGENS